MLNDFLLGTSILFSEPVGIALFVAGLLGACFLVPYPESICSPLELSFFPLRPQCRNPRHHALFSHLLCRRFWWGNHSHSFQYPRLTRNAPTAFDGYPMTLKGQAGKAVGAAVICSAFGGLVSCIVMMAATPLIAMWAVKSFGPPEIFGLICFGLAVSASVGAKSLWKGILSVGLGLLIATIGSDPSDGIARFNFDSYYLLAGIHFIPMVLGLFAVSEVFAQTASRVSGVQGNVKIGLEFPTWMEFWVNKFVVYSFGLYWLFCGNTAWYRCRARSLLKLQRGGPLGRQR